MTLTSIYIFHFIKIYINCIFTVEIILLYCTTCTCVCCTFPSKIVNNDILIDHMYVRNNILEYDCDLD